ncbi:MAG: [FeFe] hydrogenase H-cluster radical SAM maturase HydE [Ruminococcaceae bacterium]|nr:[FeFe] hydrogenase H-cluster radical SAM maturase HydE [Oscillospiraceae bacterium]
MYTLIDKLRDTQNLTKNEWLLLLKHLQGTSIESALSEYLFSKSRSVQKSNYGKKVFIRGLIEISNICKNDCLYCGIRASNKNAQRYRLTPEEILTCADEGHEIGFRTFVLQGGEDPYFTDGILCEIITKIKNKYNDSAVTLSLGERTKESYEKLKKAGADRYLLRHETANESHYAKLHPANLKLSNRKECLFNLKQAGFQTGSGFMVGSPFQTTENLVEDMLFLKELDPAMVGIGPFIPHCDTPFAQYPNGSVELTLHLIALIRLMLPKALIPATTALGTLDKQGREKGILAGANVIMPNLSPESARKKYTLYNNKLHSGAEAAEHLRLLKEQMNKIGYEITIERGDYLCTNTTQNH